MSNVLKDIKQKAVDEIIELFNIIFLKPTNI